MLVAFKLWLVASDEVVARLSPYDQQRYAEMARELAAGRWLGAYDHYTLVREATYPLWMVAVLAAGVPLRIANEALLAFGVIEHPLRILNTSIAVHIAMIHILLPYMILPIANALRQIDPSLGRAASGALESHRAEP